MSASLPKTGAASDPDAWHDLEDSLARLGQLARSAVAPEPFYRELLAECVRTLAASGGAVWLRATMGPLQPVVQINWSAGKLVGDARHAHERLLTDAAASGHVVSVSARAASVEQNREAGDSSDSMLLVGSVLLRREQADELADRPPQRSVTPADTVAAGTLAIIEIQLQPQASPAACRGYEQFLAAVCDVAADYHAHSELVRLRQDESYRDQLLRLASLVHRSLRLSETAYVVANEGRRVIGCDRLSVLTAQGNHSRLLAASGVSRVERRSSAVRQLEQLAELVRRAQEPTWYSDGVCDTLPPIAEAVERHAEQSHARQVAAIPLNWLADRSPNPSDDPARNRPSHAGDGARFVLVAEQFEAGNDFARERLVEVGQVCSTALYNALEVDQLPLGWLVRPLSTAKQAVVKHLTPTATIAAFATVAVAALALVPADFHVEAPGTLQPVVRRDVFAPRSGLVDEVLVQHGDHVASGQALVRLRDPQLELERKRVDGELETASRQLDAVRATKTQRAIRDGSAVDTYRLSAEQRELEQQQANLRQERALLDHERDKLIVTSPIAGRVLTWDVANRLITRPVERGEVLVTVADLSADWQLEIDVADDRIGHVIAARDAIRSDLPVDFRLISDDRELHHGHIHEVCMTADVEAKQETVPSPTVLVKVAFDAEALGVPIRGELRPGVSARARIACGRRSLGYVWFHDLWDAVVGWLRF